MCGCIPIKYPCYQWRAISVSWEGMLLCVMIGRGKTVLRCRSASSYANPDPSFHLDKASDPTFHFDAVPDPDPHRKTQICDLLSADPPRLHCERPRPSIFSLCSSWIFTLMRIRILLSMGSDSDPYRSGSATLGTLGMRRVNFSGFPLVLLGEGVHTYTIRTQYCEGTRNIIYFRFRTAPSAPAADLSFQKRNEEVDLPLFAKKKGISP